MLPSLAQLRIHPQPQTPVPASRLSPSVGMCLSNPEPDVLAHPDCSNSQMGVLEGEDGSFSVLNYVRISGKTKFLIWPVPHEYLTHLDDNYKGECLASHLDRFIAQPRPKPVYRGLGAPEPEPDITCPIKLVPRLDGSHVLAVDMSELGGGRRDRSGLLVGKIREELKNAGDNAETEDQKDNFAKARNSLKFDDTRTNSSLNEVLEALDTCVAMNMSLLLGLPPPGVDTGAFVITFKGLKPDPATGRLSVPCLGLIHEDANQPQPLDNIGEDGMPTNLYIHTNAVRSSYWVYAITAPDSLAALPPAPNPVADELRPALVPGFFNKERSVFIKHGAGTDYTNEVGFENNKYSIFSKTSVNYEAGVKEVPLPRKEEYNDYEDQGPAPLFGMSTLQTREESERAILKKVMDIPEAWPGNARPTSERVLSATNLVLARVGNDPVAEIEIGPAVDMFHRDVVDVRDRLEKIAYEREYTKTGGAPLPELEPAYRAGTMEEPLYRVLNPYASEEEEEQIVWGMQ